MLTHVNPNVEIFTGLLGAILIKLPLQAGLLTGFPVASKFLTFAHDLRRKSYPIQ